jgi:hypothetical protein
MKIAPTRQAYHDARTEASGEGPNHQTEADVLAGLRIVFDRYPDACGEGPEALASMMSIPPTEAWIIEAALVVLRGEGGEVLS